MMATHHFLMGAPRCCHHKAVVVVTLSSSWWCRFLFYLVLFLVVVDKRYANGLMSQQQLAPNLRRRQHQQLRPLAILPFADDCLTQRHKWHTRRTFITRCSMIFRTRRRKRPTSSTKPQEEGEEPEMAATITTTTPSIPTLSIDHPYSNDDDVYSLGLQPYRVSATTTITTATTEKSIERSTTTTNQNTNQDEHKEITRIQNPIINDLLVMDSQPLLHDGLVESSSSVVEQHADFIHQQQLQDNTAKPFAGVAPLIKQNATQQNGNSTFHDSLNQSYSFNSDKSMTVLGSSERDKEDNSSSWSNQQVQEDDSLGSLDKTSSSVTESSLSSTENGNNNNKYDYASFFKNWKYLPLQTSTTLAASSVKNQQDRNNYNDNNNNMEESVSMDVAIDPTLENSSNNNNTNNNNDNTPLSSSSSKTTKSTKRTSSSSSSTITTPLITDHNDIASFFQNWRYQPVTAPPSSSNNNNFKRNDENPSTLPSTLGLEKTDTSNQTNLISIDDLQDYLRSQGYIRQSDLPYVTTTTTPPKSSYKTSSYSPALPSSSSSSMSSSSASRGSSSTGSSSSSSTTSSGAKTIAFPQKTVMKEVNLRIACVICASTVSAMLATTVWPNLWLVGGVMGGLYGSSVAVAYANATAVAQQPLDAAGPLVASAAPSSYAALAILYMGRRLAQAYLYLAWLSQTIWFLYKTGQLSLEYYKQYAALDDRFHIQSKLDAINSRFVQAKLDFDKWEKENEVGRKLLATLRTAWYIEEQSLAKRQQAAMRDASWYGRSRYRVVQCFWDVYFWMMRVVQRVWNLLTGRANAWRGWTEFWKGVSRDLQEAMTSSDQWGSRIGAVVAAYMAVNAIGAMFAISPSLLNLSAVLFAIMWPSWMSEVVDRTGGWLDEIKAKGRETTPGIQQQQPPKDTQLDRSIVDPTWEWIQTIFAGGPVPATAPAPLSSSSSSKKSYLNLFLFRRYDKNRYHYYRRADGSRRFYRSGNPLFGRPRIPSTTLSSSKSVTRRSSNMSNKKGTEQGSWWPWSNNNDGYQASNKKNKKKNKKRTSRTDDPGREQWGLFGGG